MNLVFKNIIKRHGIFLILLLAFGVFLKFFYRLQIRQEIFSDFWPHLWLFEIYQKEGQLIFPPLYYISYVGLLKLMPFLLTHSQAASIILILAFLAKFTLIYFYMINSLQRGYILMAILSLGLLFFFPIYLFDYEGSYWYMGKFTPNVWHNCTLTFVWPFSFLLFWDSLRWFDQPSAAKFWRMGLWSILILLAKPSFLFAFLPVFLVLGWLKRPKWQKAILLFVTILLFGILGMKEIIYSNSLDQLIYGKQTSHQVTLLPFAVYKLYADTPLLEFLASFAFPLVAFTLLGKVLFEDFAIQFALLIVAFSLLIYLLFAEIGPRFADSNFYWQIPIALSILYICITKQLVRLLLQKKELKRLNWKYASLFLVFLGNIASGIYYLQHYIDTKDYL